jgi:hypothetical protein
MLRTNIYLDERQLALLRGLSEARGEPVAALVRQAVDSWLEAQGVQTIPPDEWERRFIALLSERSSMAREKAFRSEFVERDVLDAIREVRGARAARRR